MAGPITSLLFDTISPSWVWDEIVSDILKVSEKMEGNDFFVSSTVPINGSAISVDKRKITIEKYIIDSNSDNYTPEELINIKKAIGFSPKFVLNLYACSNKDIDHTILGELSLIWAEKFKGIIDFGGAIYPYNSLPEEMKKGMWLWEKANWIDIKPYFDEMIQSINGKIFTIEYDIDNHRNWVFHLCDAKFMKNWLKNPNYRLIK